MQQHDIPELTPDEELDRTRVLPDPVDPLEGSARLPDPVDPVSYTHLTLPTTNHV